MRRSRSRTSGAIADKGAEPITIRSISLVDCSEDSAADPYTKATSIVDQIFQGLESLPECLNDADGLEE